MRSFNDFTARSVLEELAPRGLICYDRVMAKSGIPTTITTVRDSKSGRFVTVKGAGALKGKMTISKKVDLTKPISGTNSGGKWSTKSGSSGVKTAPKDTATNPARTKRSR